MRTVGSYLQSQTGLGVWAGSSAGQGSRAGRSRPPPALACPGHVGSFLRGEALAPLPAISGPPCACPSLTRRPPRRDVPEGGGRCQRPALRGLPTFPPHPPGEGVGCVWSGHTLPLGAPSGGEPLPPNPPERPPGRLRRRGHASSHEGTEVTASVHPSREAPGEARREARACPGRGSDAAPRCLRPPAPPPRRTPLFGGSLANCKNSSGVRKRLERPQRSLGPGNGASGLLTADRSDAGRPQRGGPPVTESELLGRRRSPVKGGAGSEAERQQEPAGRVRTGDGCAAAGRRPEAGRRPPVDARRQVVTRGGGQSRSPLGGLVSTHRAEAGVKVLRADGVNGAGRAGREGDPGVLGHPVSRF